MRYYISLLLFLLIGANYGTAQNTVKMSAVKANDYGVAKNIAGNYCRLYKKNT